MAKILVVDDEEHIRLLYSEELTEAGYEVITAADGYELTERIEKEKPDMVILDIKMIDYNGLDLLRILGTNFITYRSYFVLPTIPLKKILNLLLQTSM